MGLSMKQRKHVHQQNKENQHKREKDPNQGKVKGKSAKNKSKIPMWNLLKQCVNDCIACDGCDSWFHAMCIEVADLDALSDDMWFCEDCSKSVTTD